MLRLGEIRPGRSSLAEADVKYLVAIAARAPSLRNTQPWKFRVSGSAIEVLADRERLLRHHDPAGRELMISCGAAVFGLRLASRKLGYLPETELLPDLARPSLVARVGLAGCAPVTRQESELLAAVPHRHTHRGPFSPGEVSARLLAALGSDATCEGAQLVLIEDASQVAALAGLVRDAAAAQLSNPNFRAELRQWVLPAGSSRSDGVPAHARAGRRGDAAGLWLPQRDFGLPGTGLAGGVPPSATAVLTTGGDTAADWIRAGQALHRILLHAATRWVFASLHTGPLEIARYRKQVSGTLRVAGYPQMLLQLGRANTAAATARRPQAELMAD